MTPLRITLKGFSGVRSGLGREELTVDLESLGDGLVAIKGPNGAGKSTLLDNLHPYRLMPSRASGYSSGSFSYYDQVHGAEASKELLWEHEGERYRSTILIRQPGKTRKQECYLHRQTAAGWVPVTLDDGTTSDGKTETYDHCVNTILGSPEMFFTAVFAAQSRPALSSYGNSEIKALLAELLGLDDIRALGTRAGAVAKILRGRLDGMRGELSRLATLDAELSACAAQTADAEAARAASIAARAAARSAVTEAEQTLRSAEAAAAGAQEAMSRRSAVQSRMRDNDTQARAALDAIEHDRSAANDRRQRASADSAARASGIEQQQKAVSRQLHEIDLMLAEREAIERAIERAAILATEEETAAAAEAAARTSADAARTGRIELDGLAASLAGLAREGKQLSSYAAALVARAALIEAVPCAGTEMQGACSLLADARAAAGEAPAANAAVEEARATWQATEQRRAALAERLRALALAEDEHRRAASALEAIRRDRRSAETKSAQALALAQAESQQRAALESVAALAASLATERDQQTREAEEHRTALAELARRADEVIARRASVATALDAELAALPEPGDIGAVERARQALIDAEWARDAADRAAEAAGQVLAAAVARRDRITHDIAAGESARASARALEDEIARWQLLGKALGNDGIVALSIDDVGPTLASLANDLLLSCYGPRFSVSILTQTETAKGEMRESFDIVVFDAERDDAKSVRAMSGGERIWINECLARAIALYRGAQTGASYGTLFTDETDGPLDPERKRAFMSMKRKVLEVGGYRREFFITHTPDLWDEADAVIDMITMKEAA